ncbi:WD repeat-containing protein 34-like protein [Leptotrombidium deliense]|uniref:WD repeat-containing protein 34-like protein n=1 Tax=Leptotrombidium deliense TaxID=299467 RepID=A0A443SMZ9_9ACAR|nr:WD repeat-containing protein 34-like protein [Leptotrombidium deliense]
MFQRTALQNVRVKSTWRYEKSTLSQSVQTDEVHFKECNTQFPHTSTNYVQTEAEPEFVVENTGTIKYDSKKLNKFLEKCLPIVKDEIEKSQQFSSVWEKSLKLWNKCINEVKYLRSFYSTYLIQLLNDQQKENKYYVSAATLNCSATSVAVTYKVNTHDDWCTHQSFVFIWSLFRSYGKSSQPFLVVETDGCISTIEAHISMPSVYAIGTVNGKIAVINTRLSDNDNYVMAVSPTVEYLHKDSITVLKWLKQSNKKVYSLISCSLDGKIIVWTVNESKKEMEPTTVYLILLSDLPRTMSVKSSAAKSNAEVGVTTLSVSAENEDVFVIGCQGGAVFQCSFSKQMPAKVDTEEFDYPLQSDLFKSPINLAYVPHRLNVTSVHFSPHSRNKFLSAAFDNELRVYTLLDSKPLAVFHCEFNSLNATWIPMSPIIVSSHENGLISVYTFNENKKSLKIGRTFALENNQKTTSVNTNYCESNSEILVTTNVDEVHLLDLKDILNSIEI